MADAVEAPPEPHLGTLVRRALQWSFAGAVIVRLGTFLSTLVMARLLMPRDFGVYSVGAVALIVTASINDIGIEQSLVRWPSDLSSLAPTAITVVMTFSLVIFAGFWFVSPAFAKLFNAPDGTNVVRLMSVGLLISGAFTVNSALTTRAFRQRIRTSAEAAGMVVTIVLSIVLARNGFGAYSLAWGHIAGNLTVGAVLFICSPVRYRPGFHLPTARLLVNHGLPLAGAGLLAVAILNVDYLVVGSVLGAVPLGFYMLAWNMANWPISLFSGAVNKVSVPGFAKLQHDPVGLNEAFARSFGVVVAVTIPFCVLLGGLGLSLVRVVYGPKWAPSSGPLVFLAAMAAIRVTTLLATDVLVAVGRSRATFVLQGLWLVSLAPALALGAHLDGIRGVGVGHLVVAACVACPAYAFALKRDGFAVMDLARAVARPLLGAALIAVVVLGVMRLAAPDPVRLTIGGMAGLAVYLVAIRDLWIPLAATRWPHPWRAA